MQLNDYQDDTAETALYPLAGTGDIVAISYAALGLAGEAGEIANKVKKILRDAGGKLTLEMAEAIEKELGDVLWYWSRMVTEIGSSADEVAEANLAKLRDRKERGVIQGSGDNR